MGSEKKCEGKESRGSKGKTLKGITKRLFGLGSSGGCCDDIKIVQVEENEEKKKIIKKAD